MKLASNNSTSFLSESSEEDEIDFTDYSAPLLSGHSFALRCHYFWSSKRRSLGVNPTRDNDCIFVRPHELGDLFGSGLLPERFSLLTHNSDYVIDSEGYARFLNDPRLRLWFAMNKASRHPKLVSIVDGLQNAVYGFGHAPTYLAFRHSLGAGHQSPGHYKSSLFYANYTIGSRPSERAACAALHQPQGVPLSARTTFLRYLLGMAEAAFTFCPGGSGIESCRPYEALYMKSIPIVRRNLPSLELVEDHQVPMVILNDWHEDEFRQFGFGFEKWHRMMEHWDPAEMYMDPYIARLNAKYGAGL